MEFKKVIKAKNHLSPVIKALTEEEIKPAGCKKKVKIKIEAGGKDCREYICIMIVEKTMDRKTILKEARKKATEISDFYNFPKDTRKLSIEF